MPPKGYDDARRAEAVALPADVVVPVGAVSFAGLVTTEDIRCLTAYKQLTRVSRIFIAWGLLVPLAIIGIGWWLVSWLTLVSLVYPWLLWRSYHRSIRHLMKSNATIMSAAGVVESEKLIVVSFSETSTLRWDFFKSMQVSDAAIGLEHAIGSKFYSILSRRQFVSDADWNRTIEIISQQLPKREPNHLQPLSQLSLSTKC
jgi:hypothetical protein